MTRMLQCVPTRVLATRPSGTVCFTDTTALYCTRGQIAPSRRHPVRPRPRASPDPVCGRGCRVPIYRGAPTWPSGNVKHQASRRHQRLAARAADGAYDGRLHGNRVNRRALPAGLGFERG
jgi:hypothetical protein